MRSRWLDTGLVLFCVFISISINKNAQKNEANIKSSCFYVWSMKDLLYGQKENFYLRDQRGKSRAGKVRAVSQPECRFRLISRIQLYNIRCSQCTHLGSLNTFCIKITNSSDDMDHKFTTSASPDCFIVLAL